MNITIRAETAADIPTIEAVTVAAFLTAPHTSHTEQQIVTALRSAGKLTVSLVAEVGGAVVAHTALSPVSICDGSPNWFGLGPVSVLPKYQRRGIGSRLVRAALGILRDHGASGCVVLGDPEYYGRFGFRADTDLVLPEVPPEYFQILTLRAPKPNGIVSYHAAFSL